MYELTYLLTHPVQYQVPLIRRLSGKCRMQVIYERVEEASAHYEADFDATVDWGLDLLTGYDWSTHEASRSGLRLVRLRDALQQAERGSLLWLHGYHYPWIPNLMTHAKRRGLRIAVRSDVEEGSVRSAGTRRRLKDAILT